ncbi:hypothetical protein IQ238_02895 [Pleurocapsales cyanobacterium LEGE 06147]|nr:hypothetical protein [Pleurocapsales cyanobacterium LEGE 06147]
MSTLLSSETKHLAFDIDTAANRQQSSFQSMPACYQADQQVKYLHLQAEIDVLLQQLQTLKQDKLSSERVQAD